MASQNSLADFYERRAAEKNLTSDNPEMTGLVARIRNWCAISDGCRVLDLGCYDGYILRRLRARNAIAGVGVDISRNALEAARRAARVEDSTDLEFLVSDGAALPFVDGSFDVVVCSEVLEHVPDFDITLSEISRVLATGGRLYATMPNALSDVWWPFRPLCRRVDRVEGHLRRMAKREFVTAMGHHALQVTRFKYRGFVLSALWYRTFIYSPRIKRTGLSLINSGPSRRQSLLRVAAYTVMRLYIHVDAVFAWSRRCMGIDAAFVKT